MTDRGTSAVGQTEKNSMRANVVRVAPESGHSAKSNSSLPRASPRSRAWACPLWGRRRRWRLRWPRGQHRATDSRGGGVRPDHPTPTALCRCAYPRNFGRHENNCNGRNKRQCGSHCADRSEWVLLDIKKPSKPIDEFFASEKATGYKQGGHVKPQPNRGSEACPIEHKVRRI